MVKNLPANARDTGSIPGSGRPHGRGNVNPLLFLPGESHGQRGICAKVHWATKSQTQLNEHTHTPNTKILDFKK